MKNTVLSSAEPSLVVQDNKGVFSRQQALVNEEDKGPSSRQHRTKSTGTPKSAPATHQKSIHDADAGKQA